MYAKITGDYNPLHFDEKFASKTKFGKLISQGSITTGLIHAIVAMDIPGPGSVFLNQNFQFLSPVYLNEVITAKIEVYEVHPSKPVTKIKIEIKNQDNLLILEGTAVCYTMLPINK